MAATDYFFARLETLFGKGRFDAQYPDDSAKIAAKKEWCRDIAKYSKDQLDKRLTLAKQLMGEDSMRWPDIGAILNLSSVNGASGAAAASFKPLPEPDLPEQTDEVKRAGRSAIDSLMTDLDNTDYLTKEKNRLSRAEEIHRADMRGFIDKYGCNYIRRTADGMYHPTDIQVPRGNGICDADFVDTGTLK